MFNKDVLDSLETPLKDWLISYFESEKVVGYATLLRQGMQEVCALELLDEFKTALAPDLYERLLSKAVTGPTISLYHYIRDHNLKGPFACRCTTGYSMKDKSTPKSISTTNTTNTRWQRYSRRYGYYSIPRVSQLAYKMIP